jgi:hypothetical protein
MTETPSYAILGRGRWAKIMQGILANEGRSTTLIEGTRRIERESETDYKSRLSARMKESAAQIAWLCTTPGPHVPLMTEAAVDAGLHVIVEKPWLHSREQTHDVYEFARSKGRLIGIHHEYCLLDGIQEWRKQFGGGKGLQFGGRFSMNRPDRVRIPAIDNFGCHLMAIWEYAVPESGLAGISCEYERPDERRVWLESNQRTIASVDFLGSSERIIQRYIAAFEAAIGTGSFPFDLDFAARVAERLADWKKAQTNSRK